MLFDEKFLEEITSHDYCWSGLVYNQISDRSIFWFSFKCKNIFITGRKDVIDDKSDGWSIGIHNKDFNIKDRVGAPDSFITMKVSDNGVMQFIAQLSHLKPRKNI